MTSQDDITRHFLIWKIIGYLSRTSRDPQQSENLVASEEFQCLFEILADNYD